MAAGDAADALGLHAEVWRHVGVAHAIAIMQGAHDVLTLLAEPALEVGDGVERCRERLGALDGVGSGECGELLERFGWGGHALRVVGTR